MIWQSFTDERQERGRQIEREVENRWENMGRGMEEILDFIIATMNVNNAAFNCPAGTHDLTLFTL